MESKVSAPVQKWKDLLGRHVEALLYVLTVIVPMIVRHQRRPVIFSRYTGMGDIICTIPAALELRRRHPGGVFVYNCHADFAPIPRLARVAERVTSFKHIGVVGHWYRFLLGGFYHFAHGDDSQVTVAQEPMVAEFCRQFGAPVTDQHPALAACPEVVERVKALLAARNLDPAELVLIHPGPSWPVKEWPRESWARLVEGLKSQGHAQVAQLGVERYMNFGQVAVDPIPGAVSLVNAFSVEECVAVISMAKLFVGIDSGLLHIAASTRTRAVGVFGSTSPQFFYAPGFRRNFVVSDVECAGCYHRLPRLHWVTGCPYDIRCMRTLDPDAVLRACVAELSSSAVR